MQDLWAEGKDVTEDVDKVIQLLRLGLDKGAQEGESQNALAFAGKMARKQSIHFEHIERRIYECISQKPFGDKQTSSNKEKAVFDPDIYRMKWGKYKGKTITEIVESDPSYVEWLTSEFLDEGTFLHKLFEQSYDSVWGDV